MRLRRKTPDRQMIYERRFAQHIISASGSLSTAYSLLHAKLSISYVLPSRCSWLISDDSWWWTNRRDDISSRPLPHHSTLLIGTRCNPSLLFTSPLLSIPLWRASCRRSWQLNLTLLMSQHYFTTTARVHFATPDFPRDQIAVQFVMPSGG